MYSCLFVDGGLCPHLFQHRPVAFQIGMTKRDTELKLLLGCTPEEAELVLRAHNGVSQAGMLVP